MLKRRVWKPIAGIIFFVLILCVALFFYTLIKLDILLPQYLIIVAAVMALLVFLVGFLLYHGLHRKRSHARRVRRIVGVTLAVIVAAVSLLGAYILSGVERTKQAITNRPASEIKGYITVYVRSDDAAQELASMGDYRFGVMAKNDELSTRYALGEINTRTGKAVEAVSYPGISDAAAALMDGDVNALAVSESYLGILSETERFSGFTDQVRVIERIAVPNTATLDNVPAVNYETVEIQSEDEPEVTPEPTPEPTPAPIVRKTYGEDACLIFYLSGIDKWEGTESMQSHSDVNILVAVNTRTKQVLILNTPRDFFVTNPALGGGDKLTHCAVQGVYNSIAALENLYELHVNNYIKVNFEGFVRFINAIGGIDVDNPKAFQNETGSVKFVEGMNHLDGGGALVYARERHAFPDGDLARNRNQVRVLNAIINKLKSSGATLLLNYNEILDTMTGTFETDLTSSQMSDLIKIALGSMSEWDIKNYAASGVSGKRVTASGGSEPLFIIWPTQSTVDFAKELVRMIQNDEIITDELIESAPRY